MDTSPIKCYNECVLKMAVNDFYTSPGGRAFNGEGKVIADPPVTTRAPRTPRSGSAFGQEAETNQALDGVRCLQRANSGDFLGSYYMGEGDDERNRN